MFGALGLFRQLSALGKGMSRPPLPKIRKRLPEAARLELEELLAVKKARMNDVREEAENALQFFLSQHGMGPRPNTAKERGVVSEFILGKSASMVDPSTGRTLESTGGKLLVDGRPVATRRGGWGSQFLEVCPGDFGEDKTHRRAANALLSVMGAGLRFGDRDNTTFIGPSGAHAARLVSPKGCYRVEVSKKLMNAAAEASAEAQAATIDIDLATTIADAKEQSEANLFNGMPRRSRKSRRSRR